MDDLWHEPFHGAKAALFVGQQLLVLLRDDKPDIDYPDHWDFPGGGREGAETPFQTLAREMEEEVGLDAHAAARLWTRRLPSDHRPGAFSWFFVLHMAEGAEAGVVFGDEGQRWELMAPEDFVALPNAVPSLVARLHLWRDETGGTGLFGPPGAQRRK